jgi:hypothetical protein
METRATKFRKQDTKLTSKDLIPPESPTENETFKFLRRCLEEKLDREGLLLKLINKNHNNKNDRIYNTVQVEGIENSNLMMPRFTNRLNLLGTFFIKANRDVEGGSSEWVGAFRFITELSDCQQDFARKGSQAHFDCLRFFYCQGRQYWGRRD